MTPPTVSEASQQPPARRRSLAAALATLAAVACILLVVVVVLPAARSDPYTRQTLDLTGSATDGGRLFLLNCADGNGQIRDPAEIHVMKEPFDGLQVQLEPVEGLRDPKTGHWRRQFSGIIFGQAPLDPRESLYVKYGDWFAAICLATTLLVAVVSLSRR